MNRTRAIELCLMSIESLARVSNSDRLTIMEHLELIYQAGYDKALLDVNAHAKKPVVQIYNKAIINRFESIIEAARICAIPLSTLRNNMDKRGYKHGKTTLIKEEDYQPKNLLK